MACRLFKLPGGFAIVCRGPRPRACSVCRAHVGDKLCDGLAPMGAKRRTCDAALCGCCARTKPDPKKQGDTIDLCPSCVKSAPPEQLALGGK